MDEVNKNTELDNTDKKLHISDVSGSVSVIDEGNINYHLERGGYKWAISIMLYLQIQI